jgi:glycosyltransferase involved in cell wall biosynthesis
MKHRQPKINVKVSEVSARSKSKPLVSIIVPARNEEHVLPDLLQSLKRIDYPALEIIVVDDCSSDSTSKIAEEYGCRVVSGQPRPGGWNGKQWACHQGFLASNGEILIFTDADTVHLADSVDEMLNFLDRGNLDMSSALPFHDCRTVWEKLMGPFHLLLIMVTAPFAVPRRKRVFAVGQYLVFRRQSYLSMGGHAAVRQCWVEDLPLANLAISSRLRYQLFTDKPLHKVRMYPDLKSFIAGWRRNFRAGLGDSSYLAPAEIALLILAFTGGWGFGSTWISLMLMVSTVCVAMALQRRHGSFSNLGPILFGFSLVIFCYVTLLAAIDMVFRRNAKWKGRSFAGESTGQTTSAFQA